MVWLFLILAIVLEVGAALSLRLATGGRKLFYIAVVVGYLGAFFFLTQVLALGLGIGVAYGIWAASGVALTAMLSSVIFHEPVTVLMGIGLALIMGGVLCVEIGAQKAHTQDEGAALWPGSSSSVPSSARSAPRSASAWPPRAVGGGSSAW